MSVKGSGAARDAHSSEYGYILNPSTSGGIKASGVGTSFGTEGLMEYTTLQTVVC